MLKKILPHLSIIVSTMMLVLYIIDSVNDAMGFLRGDEFKTLLLILIIVSIVTASFLIRSNAKDNK